MPLEWTDYDSIPLEGDLRPDEMKRRDGVRQHHLSLATNENANYSLPAGFLYRSQLEAWAGIAEELRFAPPQGDPDLESFKRYCVMKARSTEEERRKAGERRTAAVDSLAQAASSSAGPRALPELKAAVKAPGQKGGYGQQGGVGDPARTSPFGPPPPVLRARRDAREDGRQGEGKGKEQSGWTSGTYDYSEMNWYQGWREGWSRGWYDDHANAKWWER